VDRHRFDANSIRILILIWISIKLEIRIRILIGIKTMLIQNIAMEMVGEMDLNDLQRINKICTAVCFM
jgi:hypothetical protein